jgi:hypothetical protein
LRRNRFSAATAAGDRKHKRRNVKPSAKIRTVPRANVNMAETHRADDTIPVFYRAFRR